MTKRNIKTEILLWCYRLLGRFDLPREISVGGEL
jgi:hypothetical protein